MAIGTGGREFVPHQGAFGDLPPDAPREKLNNDPAAIRGTAEQVAMARRYEQELAPLTFKDSINPAPLPTPVVPTEVPVLVDPSGAPITSAAVPEPIVTSSIVPPKRRDRWASAVVVAPAVPAAAEPAAPEPSTPVEPAAPSQSLAAAAAALRPDRPTVLTEADLQEAGAQAPQPYRPAASDTDSPSRGQPVASADPGKQITGGFSGVGDAQYFPLDGMEVRELINGLLSQLHERLKDDLRFTIATTYPRARVKVEITVEAFGMDHAVVVQAVAPPHTKTPIEVARDRADEIVFVIVAERNEKFSADGEGHSTNQTRRDLGLEVPFKRQVGGVTFDRA